MAFFNVFFKTLGFLVAVSSFIIILNILLFFLPADKQGFKFIEGSKESSNIIATLNLNGDYISDALAAEVGGIGIAPGANLGEKIALFEATHGTAPKYAGLDKVNPGSLILSAEMMLRYMGWMEAADLIIEGLARTISQKTVTYDFERLMSGASLLKCSEFGEAIISNMD